MRDSASRGLLGGRGQGAGTRRAQRGAANNLTAARPSPFLRRPPGRRVRSTRRPQGRLDLLAPEHGAGFAGGSARRFRLVAVSPSWHAGRRDQGDRGIPEPAQPVRICRESPLIGKAGTCARFKGVSGRPGPTSCRRWRGGAGKPARARRDAHRRPGGQAVARRAVSRTAGGVSRPLS